MSLVRMRRHAIGMTQKRLADLTGLHHTVISKIETGARDLKVEDIVKIAQALRCHPKSLLPSLATLGEALIPEDAVAHA